MVNGTLQTIAGTYGSKGISGSDGPATSAIILGPFYLFLDATLGFLYISDYDSAPTRTTVRKINLATGIISLYAGGGTSTATYNIAATSASLTTLSFRGIVGDTTGNIYVSDVNTFSVYKVNTTGFLSHYAGNGISSASLTNNVIATNASLGVINGLKIDTSGNLYLRGFDQNNTAIVTAEPFPTSQHSQEPTRPPNQPTGQPSRQPTGQPSHRPTKQPSEQPTRRPSRQPTSQPNRRPTSQPSQKPTGNRYGYIQQLVSGISLPWNVYVDTQGYMHIGTALGKVYKASVSGRGAATVMAGGGTVTNGTNIPATSVAMGSIHEICGDTSGNLYWPDYTCNVIWSYSPIGGYLNIIAGVYSTSSGLTADGQLALGHTLNGPSGIAIGTNGYLYWTEQYSCIVRKAFATNGILQTFVGKAAIHGNTGDGGPATSATIYTPTYLYLDSNSNLFIVDVNNYNIRKVTPAGIISLFAGGGSSTANNIAATSTSLSSLTSVTGDSNGNIYISNYAVFYIYKVNTAGILSYYAGNGVSSASLTDNVAATSTSINKVYGMKVDTSGNLYIAGYSQCNVAEVIYTPASPISRPSSPVSSLLGPQVNRVDNQVEDLHASLLVSRQDNLVKGHWVILQYCQPISIPSRSPSGHPTELPSEQPSTIPSFYILSTSAPSHISYVSASSERVPALNWSAVALNTHAGRGVKKYAVATQVYGGIYASQSPVTLKWSLSSNQAVSWKSAVLSYSGQYQLAGSSAGGLCGQSADYGASWNISTVCTASTGAAIRYVSMDGSGQYRLASTYADHVLDDDNFTLLATTTVYLSSDYGQAWHTVNVSHGFAAAINGNASLMIVAAYNVSQESVYYSLDQGNSWWKATFSVSLVSPVCGHDHWVYATVSYEGRYAPLLQSNGKIGYSSNYAQTWTRLVFSTTQQLHPRLADSISISSTGQYWLIVHANETSSYLSKGYAATWQEVDCPCDAGGVKQAALETDGSAALLSPSKPMNRPYVYSIPGKGVFVRPGMV